MVTSAVNVAMELSKRKDLDVFVTGDICVEIGFSLVGPVAAQSLSNLLVRTVFLGADGIDLKWGLSCYNPDEAQLNSTMETCAKKDRGG